MALKGSPSPDKRAAVEAVLTAHLTLLNADGLDPAGQEEARALLEQLHAGAPLENILGTPLKS